MCIEIEAKLKVDSLEQIRDRLGKLGAEFVAELSQKDILFDDVNDTIKKADSCLRLREQAVSGDRKYILAYKGAKEESNFKKRQEIEIEITDYDSTCRLISALGYEQKMIVEKSRGLWRFGGCEVALDNLPLLGNFVEIEGPDDRKIANVQTQLGLDNLTHISKSYATLITEKPNQK
ncbi:class IV adenylate cyclase [Planctomycetota bacterium]